jgi:hypothetical protein
VYRNPLAARQRLLETRDRRHHVRQLKRIVKMFERGIEKTIRDRGVAEATKAQQPGDSRMEVERGGERCRLVSVAGKMLPEKRLHGVARRSASTNAIPSEPMRRNLS